ncbi:hypothetical protein [Streptomyces phaeochromogenes]|uniref:hypothetical protein n=1 Tax=Streptomyces phaeochromogenes TaxID=1923 RepID=UPI002E0EA196|nr:hypothetical protein OG437_49560 [Streptomyces phaeochromogenes]
MRRALAQELGRVREVAVAWRIGLGAILAGLVGFGLIKGRSDVGQAAPQRAACCCSQRSSPADSAP